MRLSATRGVVRVTSQADFDRERRVKGHFANLSELLAIHKTGGAPVGLGSSTWLSARCFCLQVLGFANSLDRHTFFYLVLVIMCTHYC